MFKFALGFWLAFGALWLATTDRTQVGSLALGLVVALLIVGIAAVPVGWLLSGIKGLLTGSRT